MKTANHSLKSLTKSSLFIFFYNFIISTLKTIKNKCKIMFNYFTSVSKIVLLINLSLIINFRYPFFSKIIELIHYNIWNKN